MKSFIFSTSLCALFFSFSSASFAVTQAPGSAFLYLSSEGELIVNGENKGYGANIVVDESDYAYEVLKDDGLHVVFNGKDQGLGLRPQITGGKLLFESEKDLKNTIVFNGKNYGEGESPRVKDGHFIFFRTLRTVGVRNEDQGRVLAFYDGKYYCDGESDTIKEKIQMSSSHVICEQVITSGSETKTFVVYDGKVVAEGENIQIADNNYAYSIQKDFGDGVDVEVIVYNGKEIGAGFDVQLSDNSFYYFTKNLEGVIEIVFNGRNLGSFVSKDSIQFIDGHLVFLREITVNKRGLDGVTTEVKETHVFYDGIDRGVADKQINTKSDSKKIFMAGKHLAFERTVDSIVYDANGARQVSKASYAVFDGRERTKIISGTLRMDDTGVFAFGKEVDVYDGTIVNADNSTGAYVVKDFIYKGDETGKVEQLGEGQVDSIQVQDGNVAYYKTEEVDDRYLVNGSYETRTIDKDVIFINGVKKTAGDLTTLFMNEKQNVYSENRNGRWFLYINGREQAFSGSNVLFLSKKVPTAANGEVLAIGQLEGKLVSRLGRYYLDLGNGTKERVMFVTGVSYQPFINMTIRVAAKKTNYRYTSSGTTFSAYKISKIYNTAQTASSSTSSKNIQNYKGTLEKKGITFYLRTSDRILRLRTSNTVKREELDPLLNDTLTLGLEQQGQLYYVQKIVE